MKQIQRVTREDCRGIIAPYLHYADGSQLLRRLTPWKRP